MSAGFSGFKVIFYYSALFLGDCQKHALWRFFFSVEWAGSQQWTFFKVKISICAIFGLYVGIGENCKSQIKYF